MAVKVDDIVFSEANFFRVNDSGYLELYSDAGGLDVSKVAVVAAGRWQMAKVLKEDEDA